MVKIFIDPGHGGTDPGARANGLEEKSLTLAISLKIREFLLEYENVQIRMSRDRDSSVTLQQRSSMANSWGADYFVSVHINAGGGEGYEDYIYTSPSRASVANQNIMHEEIIKHTSMVDRGKKRSNFHVVRATTMPAILTENGFIDNDRDAAKLRQSSFIERIARGHVNGLVRIFGLKRKTPPIAERKLTGMIPNWSDWQWRETEAIFKKAREQGILSSDEWEKKAADKSLTFDELEFLNLVLKGRVL